MAYMLDGSEEENSGIRRAKREYEGWFDGNTGSVITQNYTPILK